MNREERTEKNNKRGMKEKGRKQGGGVKAKIKNTKKKKR